jgi:two-component system sensor histidine kinase KdpD
MSGKKIDMNHFTRNLSHHLANYLATLVAVAFATFLLRQTIDLLGKEVIVLLYLLPVMLCTVLWGLFSGILASLVAFLAFNYFFIQPYNTLLVHQTQDLITLIIFLIVAVVTSQLIGQARESTRRAKNHEWEATRLYELISGLAGAYQLSEVTHVLAQHILETFRARQVEVRAEGGGQDEKMLKYTASDGPTATGRYSIRVLMQTARGLEGEILLWLDGRTLTTEEERLLNTIASQGAFAVERSHLIKAQYRTQVLEESDKMKTALLSSVSHELRSPLAAIKASVSSLRAGVVAWDTAARVDLLTTIEEETDHLNFLVGNLLDMSRIEAGALKPNKTWNSLEDIVIGVLVKVRKQLRDYKIEVDIPEDLPLIQVDYAMLGQVFTNLLSNSTKYGPEGSRISINARLKRSDLHVEVSNQGPPVPPEHLEHIFDKFYRVTAADRITGTGLGLSICKGIIEAHGGKIWAENRSEWFVFHFTLPVDSGALPPATPAESDHG